MLEAYRHCKTIAASGSGAALLHSLGVEVIAEPGVVEPRAGVLLTAAGPLPKAFTVAFIADIGQHRHWHRSHLAAIPA